MADIDVLLKEETIAVNLNEETIAVSFEKILQNTIFEKVFISCIAGENITSHKILSVKPDGKVYLANNTDDFPVIGVSYTSANVGSALDVLTQGDIYLASWGLSAGSRYFLSTAGGVVSVPPVAGNLLEVGVALTSDKLLFSPKSVIKLF